MKKIPFWRRITWPIIKWYIKKWIKFANLLPSTKLLLLIRLELSDIEYCYYNKGFEAMKKAFFDFDYDFKEDREAFMSPIEIENEHIMREYNRIYDKMNRWSEEEE